MNARLTVGVLTPHTTAGPELEIPAMSSGRVDVRVSRIRAPGQGETTQSGPASAPSDLREMVLPAVLDEAAAALTGGSLDALAYASTSSSYAIGFDAEVALVQRLRDRWALPVASSGLAAVSALRAFGIDRVAVVHPAWFDKEANDLAARYFQSQGIAAVASRADTLPDDPALVRPGPVVDWVGDHLSDQTEAVFLGGHGFRAAEAVERLERRTGRLVLEANQVLLWSILHATGSAIAVRRYGRLLREGRPGLGPARRP